MKESHPKDHVVEKSITINATPAQVWAALTNPELTKKYFFGTAVASDWKPGHKISFTRNILCLHFALEGKIVTVEPQRLLKYTLKNGRGRGGESTVTDRITFEHGKTKLTISDDVGEEEGAEKRYHRSVKGWEKALRGLKALIERGDAYGMVGA